MANILTDKIWNIDTQSATPLTTGPARISGVRWVGATTAAHLAVIKSGAKIVWQGRAAGVNHVEESNIEIQCPEGITVDDLDSGNLYIYLK